MNVELADSAISIQRLEKVEVSLREALQSEKDKVVQLRVAEVGLQEAKADLQATLDEGTKRMVALREQNESLQQEKTEAEDACNRERQEIRRLKQHLSEFEERSKDLESVVEREQAELNRQRAARKETEKHNTVLMAKQAETDKTYKAREAAAVKTLSDQLQKLKDNARQQLESVTSSFMAKVEEAEGREREACSALTQCQNELRRLLDERKMFQTRTNSTEIEAERLQTELRQQQEHQRSMEADLKSLRRENARLEEAVDAAEKASVAAVARCDSLNAKARQSEIDLRDKELELESANVNTDRVQNELLHERRLTQAARSQSENVDKQLQLANAKLSEERQKLRDVQNQVSEAERRVSQMTVELEAKNVELDGSQTDAQELVQCRKELFQARHALEQAQVQLQDAVPAREAAERELAKLRHANSDLVAKVTVPACGYICGRVRTRSRARALSHGQIGSALEQAKREHRFFVSRRPLMISTAVHIHARTNAHARTHKRTHTHHRRWTQVSRLSSCSASLAAKIKCSNSEAKTPNC